ncbi:mycofactocin-coupled SDR family oxidoreductase [[Mycobacterium] crassicus]|uniref:Mycofactocin-coupled SDR family oxidoreductase n=1 Tax=[Mycobacterium] crassicus TaxID=2872309 RepID=A0ABU5XI01_9MYCO|nr:mycofactocin-coupled SDR family oxidoreductase [Mycolicibacter sp. MYC098]MEB3021808.1 mycofactocin-coupled SDR family oxidoreductase [Mycolicibacter sp. MYC098]
MPNLAGKVAAVTGAARGTGRAHCERLAAAGADIIAIDRCSAADDLAMMATVLVDEKRRCFTGIADVRDLPSLSAAVDAGVTALGGLDIVIANAGVHAPGAPVWELPDDVWQDALDVNLTGVWHTVKAAAPHLRPGGSIVIINSTSGIRGPADTAHYTASKHAAVGLARTLANELGPYGIRVNTVHPGAVATPLVRNEATYRRLCPDLDNPTEADAVKILTARNLLSVPWVEPHDVANAAVFLASDDARYITGAQLVVDAGLTQKT